MQTLSHDKKSLSSINPLIPIASLKQPLITRWIPMRHDMVELIIIQVTACGTHSRQTISYQSQLWHIVDWTRRKQTSVEFGSKYKDFNSWKCTCSQVSVSPLRSDAVARLIVRRAGLIDRNKILSGGDLSHYQVPHCIRVFFYFVWFVFIHHNFQFYFELCTYCNILDIYLS